MIQAENTYTIFREQAARILSSFAAGTSYLVQLNEQEEKLHHCRKTLPLEKFFFIIDNDTFTAESVIGVHAILGYPDKIFTLKKFFSLIHPTHNCIQLINRYVLLETLMKGERQLSFLNPVLIANIALKHNSGQYLLFKWQASPFQVSTTGCLLSYLNEFTLISAFNNESCHLRVTDKNGKAVNWHQGLSPVIKNRLKTQSGFSNKEMLVLSYYTDHPLSTNASTARFFSLQTSTIITFNKRIIRKAECSFARRFSTAREVASFLHREDLI